MTGEELRKEIKKRGCTVRAAAEKMGITEQTYGQRLKGDDVSSRMMESAAEAMGISVAELYGGDGSRNDVKAEHAMLRQLAAMAMQGHIASNPVYSDERLKRQSPNQMIAEWSVEQAYSMLEEFKKRGIDK